MSENTENQLVGNQDITVDQVLAKWLLEELTPTLKFPQGLLGVRRVEPIFGRVFTTRFKVEIAAFDGTGMNPKEVKCYVVSIIENKVSSVDENTCANVPSM